MLTSRFTKKLSEARGNGIGFVAAGEAAPPSLLVVRFVVGIPTCRSARAAQHARQHAGPAGPEARCGDYLIGCRRFYPRLLLFSFFPV